MLRIMSYNIDSGIGTDKCFDPMRSMKVIQDCSPDVVALQEVPKCRPPRADVLSSACDSQSFDYVQEASAALGLNGIFGSSLGDFFGNGILSKFTMEEVTKLVLPFPAEAEPRIALVVKINAPTPFYMIATHLAYQGEYDGDDEGRALALQAIQDFIEKEHLAPVVLAGDLNAGPDSPALEFLKQNWDITNFTKPIQPTAKTGKYGWMQIDYICTYPKGAFQCDNFEVIDNYGPSDHYPVAAEVELVVEK